MSRRDARVLALQALYQQALSGNPPETVLQACEAAKLSAADEAYFQSLFLGVLKHLAECDSAFTPYLDRPLSELTPIELAILRIAVFELLHQPDVPYRVVINEALELAKQFGATDGFKYVNGILDKAARHLRAAEVSN